MADESTNSSVMTDVEALPFPEEDLAAMLDGEKEVPEAVDMDNNDQSGGDSAGAEASAEEVSGENNETEAGDDGQESEPGEEGGKQGEEPENTADDDSPSTSDEEDGSGDEQEKVILAKDGKHTIPYDELVAAREQAKEAKELAEQWRKLAEERRGESAENGDAEEEDESGDAGESIDDDLLSDEAFADLLDDYPEAAQQIKAIMQTTSTLQQKLQEMEQVIQQTALNAAVEKHFSEIAAAHSDYDKILPSEDLKTWIQDQPSFIRAEMERVYESGTAQEVVDLITAFKDQAGYGEEKQNANSSAGSKGKRDENNVSGKGSVQTKERDLPESLGDSPGSAGPTDVAEAFLQLSPAAQLEKLENMSSEKRDALLAKIM